MELRHLRYFVAVVEAQSFTKAAERLHIAQPPLSRQIQDLESQLGLLLLDRSSRPLKPTPAGQFFYQHAKRLLAQTEEVQAMTKRVASDEKIINIGFVGSLLFGLLPQVIYEFRQCMPTIKINLIEMGTVEQLDALKKGEIDVGFGRLHTSDASIKRLFLKAERLSLAVHKNHSLAQKTEGVYLTEIVNELLFLYPQSDTASFASHVLSILTEAGLDPKETRVVREVQLALGFVASGRGVCIVPESVDSIALTDLCYIPILDHIAYSPVYVSVRQMDENVIVQALIDNVAQIYGGA
ncbi:MAG: LysR family transcriptional regulator [Moraxella sp.]|nr:LysR family transcriptional regulator [Moraxella sp.]